MRTLQFIFIFAAVLLGTTTDAFCWGPAAHLHYAFHAFSNLHLYSETVATILSTNTLAYFYGSVGADIVLAKKLGSKATHCHRWDNALQLYDGAKTPRIQAFALGYLSHLAADTISHNCYVPAKTVESFDSGVLKHLYWEMRFDQKVTGPKTLKLFQEIAQADFQDCDEHMENLIPTRVLNFSWNKKIFNQLLVMQSMQQWQKMLHTMGKSEINSLNSDEFEFFESRARTAVVDFLKNLHHSVAVAHDPIGETRLKLANQLRRHYAMTNSSHPEETLALSSGALTAFKASPDAIIKIEDYQIKV